MVLLTNVHQLHAFWAAVSVTESESGPLCKKKRGNGISLVRGKADSSQSRE
jgi:hypothetical protein